MRRFSSLKGKELKAEVERIVANCEKIAASHVRTWKAVDPSWPTIEGCAYLRLSTEDQVLVEQGSLEQQIHIAVAEAIARSNASKTNYRISTFFIEPGITGTHDDRPKLKLMRRRIEGGQFRFVVMKEISRVSRDASLWMDFFKSCNANDCEVCIRGFPINPNDPAQVLQLQIMASFSEYESKQIGKRLKENIFSALVNSKKFNSTHQILGLDPIEVNGRKAPGVYQANPDELKTVTWIMETFLRYGAYLPTVEEIRRHGILNKNAKSIDSESLKRLLTNLKYIGSWEVNAENKDKNQERLPPYERYAYIEDFPHGCLIDKQLFERVQVKVRQIENSKDRNKTKRAFPLVGILRSPDGSKFHGDAGTSKTKVRYPYYYDKVNGVRLSADEIEKEAARIVSKLISDSAEIQDVIKRRCQEAETVGTRLKHEAARLDNQIAAFEAELRRLDKRLDLLIDGSGEAEARSFRDEYRKEWSRLKAEIREASEARDEILRKRREFTEQSFDFRTLGAKAEGLLALIQEKNPKALKNAYREVFEAIEVGPVEESGEQALRFVLKEETPESFAVIPAENFRGEYKMG